MQLNHDKNYHKAFTRLFCIQTHEILLPHYDVFQTRFIDHNMHQICILYVCHTTSVRKLFLIRSFVPTIAIYVHIYAKRVLSRNNFPDSRFSSRSCAHHHAFLFHTTRVRIFYPSSDIQVYMSVGWSYSSVAYNILSELNTVSRLFEENHMHALRNHAPRREQFSLKIIFYFFL